MFRRGVAICAASVLGIATVANAGAVISINQITPTPIGGFLGGETVNFSVAISTSQTVQARLLTIDFSDSSPELDFAGPDLNGNGTTEFIFSLVPPLVADALYSKFPDYPLVSVAFQGSGPTPGFILDLSGTPLVIGNGSVVLPMDPGKYLVDALNANSGSDGNVGTRLSFDFTTPTDWTANTFGSDRITGEPLSLTVVPEPATLVLLGLGGLAMLRRRKA